MNKLVKLNKDGVSILDDSVSSNLEKKKLSASMLTGIEGCPARWLVDTYVIKPHLPKEADNAMTRGSLFHKVMEDFFALEPSDRTKSNLNNIVNDVLQNSEFSYFKDNEDAILWLVNAIKNYYKMGAKPENVKVADIKGKKGLEVFVKGKIGETSRDILGYIDRVIETPSGQLFVEDWKGLTLDTVLPTPYGFTTMGEVVVGDVLLNTYGGITTVTAKSNVHSRPTYAIKFNNEVIHSDNVHLWNVVILNRETREIIEDYEAISSDYLFSLYSGLSSNNVLAVKAPQPVQEVFKDMDIFFSDFIQYSGVSEFSQKIYNDYCIDDNKFLFTRCSVSMRFKLLDAFLKYYGYADKNLENKHIIVDYAHSDGIFKSLLSSLGIPFDCDDYNGRNLISFKYNSRLVSYYYIENIENVGFRDTQCIKVDSIDSLFLCGYSMIPTHNTGKTKQWKLPKDRRRMKDISKMSDDKRLEYLTSIEGFGEQRQQLIYKMLLEQDGFDVAGARLIYPVSQGIVKVYVEDVDLKNTVIESIENVDKKLNVMIDMNNFDYKINPFCSWCPLAKICPTKPFPKFEKALLAYESQPDVDFFEPYVEFGD